MRVTINEKEVVIPSSLSEITLQQRIDFQRQHGDELDEILKSILEMEEGLEREAEELEFTTIKAYRTVSFFTGFTVDQLKSYEDVLNMMSIYSNSVKVLFEDEDSLELEREFAWNNELWYLHAPELKNGDNMKFGELIDAKQIVKDMIGLGANQWEYMLPLCAIYLRKKDEAYTESFLYEGSERQELMKQLPMDIAMQVGFFFLSSLNTWMNTSRYSGHQKLSNRGKTLKSILTSGDG